MAVTVLGVFHNREDVDDAIDHLEQKGYETQDMSIMMRDEEDMGHETRGHRVGHRMEKGADFASGVTTGATTGAVIGGIAGLLIGVGALAIPGIGVLLIAGPIATALGLTGAVAATASGAITGALAGGIVGALVRIGVPRERAELYESRIREGGILLAVPAYEDETEEVADILEEYGATDVSDVSLDGVEERYRRDERPRRHHLTHR